ncbi:MAG: hypothetical protein JXJ20_11705 [Anaerolineae bacterium]|nr:hypothetical protein [Anaerolineae bacterium]
MSQPLYCPICGARAVKHATTVAGINLHRCTGDCGWVEPGPLPPRHLAVSLHPPGHAMRCRNCGVDAYTSIVLLKGPCWHCGVPNPGAVERIASVPAPSYDQLQYSARPARSPLGKLLASAKGLIVVVVIWMIANGLVLAVYSSLFPDASDDDMTRIPTAVLLFYVVFIAPPIWRRVTRPRGYTLPRRRLTLARALFYSLALIAIAALLAASV